MYTLLVPWDRDEKPAIEGPCPQCGAQVRIPLDDLPLTGGYTPQVPCCIIELYAQGEYDPATMTFRVIGIYAATRYFAAGKIDLNAVAIRPQEFLLPPKPAPEPWRKVR